MLLLFKQIPFSNEFCIDALNSEGKLEFEGSPLVCNPGLPCSCATELLYKPSSGWVTDVDEAVVSIACNKKEKKMYIYIYKPE